MEYVRYLKNEEKYQSRSLWEHAFPDDSASFIDYYYHEINKRNRIIVIENEDGLASMLHLNPYQVVVKNKLWDSEYIVGVATRADQRRRGYMRKMIEKMLTDLYREKKEFCFLMPAHESIYLPFDFCFIFDQPHTHLIKDHGLIKQDGESLAPDEIAGWMNQYLSMRYQVYCLRDAGYVERMLKELKSEDGKLELFYDQSNLAAIRAEWGIVKKEQRMLLCDEILLQAPPVFKPAIMARIVNLSEFIKVISLKKECNRDSITVSLAVEDALIEDNNGTFKWTIDQQGSKLEKINPINQTLPNKDVLKVSISQLTGWLFGYRTLEELITVEIPEWTKHLQVIQAVFLDEVV